MAFIPLSMLVGVNHWVFNLALEQYYYFFLAIRCYKCGTTLGSGNNCFIQFNLRSFWNGFFLSLIHLLLTKT